jgi:hypothetical protein
MRAWSAYVSACVTHNSTSYTGAAAQQLREALMACLRALTAFQCDRATCAFARVLTSCTRTHLRSDHAFPFLAPVRKQDAPDYPLVIRSPMDLGVCVCVCVCVCVAVIVAIVVKMSRAGTMMKRVKRNEYASKEAFVSDLNLIWSNCRLVRVWCAVSALTHNAHAIAVQHGAGVATLCRARELHGGAR